MCRMLLLMDTSNDIHFLIIGATFWPRAQCVTNPEIPDVICSGYGAQATKQNGLSMNNVEMLGGPKPR
jgi:hypothetical protein